MSERCGKYFFKFLKVFVLRWKCVEESFLIHWKFEVCGRKFFELLKAWSFKCVKESFSHCCKFQVKFQACVIKDLQMIEVFLFKFTWGVKDFLPKLSIFQESVCFSICVQNVFFSNGVLESHGEVWWWQISLSKVQNVHDAFQTWALEICWWECHLVKWRSYKGRLQQKIDQSFCITLWMTHSQLLKGPKCGSKWNIAEEGGVRAHSLAHNILRGRGACWSSGMGLGRVDKFHSLTRAYTQPTQSG